MARRNITAELLSNYQAAVHQKDEQLMEQENIISTLESNLELANAEKLELQIKIKLMEIALTQQNNFIVKIKSITLKIINCSIKDWIYMSPLVTLPVMYYFSRR